MSNVIPLQRPAQSDARSHAAAVIQAVATGRRSPEDVFWLKENAELLCAYASTRTPLCAQALTPFEGFYAQIEARLKYYPQYYRFLLSICLDLEDLGLAPPDRGAALCDWVAAQGLAEAELSDLQRAEARRLLVRREVGPAVAEGRLGARLMRFASRCDTFALPNKKAAYELAHILFYLSEYGQRPIPVPEAVLCSLQHAGILAHLDQDLDLLAEICAAITCAGGRPPRPWQAAVTAFAAQIELRSLPATLPEDGFHSYLVSTWAARLAGLPAPSGAVPQTGLRFVLPAPREGALRAMSACLFDLGAARRSDWGAMRGHVLGYLTPQTHEVLLEAERAAEDFGGFFEIFARSAFGPGGDQGGDQGGAAPIAGKPRFPRSI